LVFGEDVKISQSILKQYISKDIVFYIQHQKYYRKSLLTLLFTGQMEGVSRLIIILKCLTSRHNLEILPFVDTPIQITESFSNEEQHINICQPWCIDTRGEKITSPGTS